MTNNSKRKNLPDLGSSSNNISNIRVLVDFELSSAFAEQEFNGAEVLLVKGEIPAKFRPGEIDEVAP
jgi:hypothetical protein